MAYQVDKGTLIEKPDTEQKTEKLRKREFAISINEGTFSVEMPFQLLNDKCELLDRFNIGDEITVYSNRKPFKMKKPDGTTKRWVNLDCWKIEAVN